MADRRQRAGARSARPASASGRSVREEAPRRFALPPLVALFASFLPAVFSCASAAGADGDGDTDGDGDAGGGRDADRDSEGGPDGSGGDAETDSEADSDLPGWDPLAGCVGGETEEQWLVVAAEGDAVRSYVTGRDCGAPELLCEGCVATAFSPSGRLAAAFVPTDTFVRVFDELLVIDLGRHARGCLRVGAGSDHLRQRRAGDTRLLLSADEPGLRGAVRHRAAAPRAEPRRTHRRHRSGVRRRGAVLDHARLRRDRRELRRQHRATGAPTASA